jgi:hypothetical protein
MSTAHQASNLDAVVLGTLTLTLPAMLAMRVPGHALGVIEDKGGAINSRVRGYRKATGKVGEREMRVVKMG